MKQPIDSLFNKKLKEHQVVAPASAWDRIDSNLNKGKRPVMFWLQIAAGIAVLIAIGITIYTYTNQAVQPLAEIQKSIPKVETENTVQTPAIATTQANPIEEPLPANVQEAKEVKHYTKNTSVQAQLAHTETPLQKELTPEIIIEPTVVVAENVAITPVEIVSENPTQTIMISAEEANAKYLNEQYVADATNENKKSSKLRNLFEKAQDLDPIGEIRQLKNEVLALNFRNEKKGERNR